MARAVGRRSCVATRYDNREQQLHTSAIVQLFRELQRDSAEQILSAMAELDHYEERLFRAIPRYSSISSTT
ncbi:hypothetical protein HRbin16_02676 [bacterium HR16]|nr:hypothetical protein HRbin16_02676 [bacterium HR16]